MPDTQLFLSYQRSESTTRAVERLSRRARVQLRLSPSQVFFDQHSIAPSANWQAEIDAALARCSHFLALVSVDYWLSEPCMHELDVAVSRYELSSSPQLLFVLADRLDPNDLAIDSSAAVQRLAQGEHSALQMRRVASAGQINFLGPYDAAGRLVRLVFENPSLLDDQFAALVDRIRLLLRSSP